MWFSPYAPKPSNTMITFHAVCYAHHRRADGTYPVKIKVTYKRVHRTLPTNLTATAADLTRTLHIKAPRLLAATNDLIGRMRDAVGGLTYYDLEGKDIDWIVAYIRRRLTEVSFSLNFIDWCESLDRNTGQTTALNAWKRFGRGNVDVNAITAQLVSEFAAYVNARPNVRRHDTAASVYTMALGVMYDKAKDKYNDEDAGVMLIPRSPFKRVKLHPDPPQGQKNLGIEMMQRIISARGGNETVQYALDLFVISFALMGANMVDLRHFKEVDGWWVYNRSKTKGRRQDKALMKVRVPACISERISRVNFERHSTVGVSNVVVNRYLGQWANENGEERFSFYAARHSWASIARSIGIEKATIDECLAHIGDYKIADIYAERNWDAINAANSRVLDLFEW